MKGRSVRCSDVPAGSGHRLWMHPRLLPRASLADALAVRPRGVCRHRAALCCAELSVDDGGIRKGGRMASGGRAANERRSALIPYRTTLGELFSNSPAARQIESRGRSRQIPCSISRMGIVSNWKFANPGPGKDLPRSQALEISTHRASIQLHAIHPSQSLKVVRVCWRQILMCRAVLS